MNYIKSIATATAIGASSALLWIAPAGALVGNDTVTSGDIVDGAVHSADIANGTITESDIANNSITSDDIGPGEVRSSEILNGGIVGGDLADDISVSTTGSIATTSTLGVTGKTTLGSTLQQKYATIASATALPLNTTAGNVFSLTGTTAVTSATVGAGDAGRVVTLINASTAQLADGNNLKLSAAGPNTADDTLTLVSDGTNWYEIGRSVN